MFVVAVICLLVIPLTNAAIVNIPNLGTIEGKIDKSLNGREFYAFEGVPYAQPPIGDRRFKPPVEGKPWKGTWMAKTIYKCAQYYQYNLIKNEDPVLGEEDCLYVNIYTPNLNQNANLDVIVYIHGGAFMFLWGGFYGPHFLLNKDVIYVTLNYRLGPLGFLSTEDEIVPGNNGIRDQNLALKFIKKHIRHFGGNPDSITLFGMSAGGASTHIHYLSPLSRGLFKQGMSQSGTALNAWVLMEKGAEKTRKIAANLGCNSETNKEMVDCLRKRPVRQIVEQVREFQPFLYNPFSPFGVVVDEWSTDPVLPEHPIELIRKGKVNDIPWIVSQTDCEGLYPAADFISDEHLEHIDTNWNELLPFILDYNYTVHPNEMTEINDKIREEYLQNRKLDQRSVVDFISILSHRLFDLDIQKTVKLTVPKVTSNIYYYLFKYKGTHNWYEWIAQPKETFGAAHAEDTAYLVSTIPEIPSSEEDRQMVEFFVDWFSDFAKTGIPKVDSVEWSPVSNNGEEIDGLVIESASRLGMEKIGTEKEQLWNKLAIRENEKLFEQMKDEL